MKKMKYFAAVLPLMLLFSFSGPKAAIEWDFTEHNFGAIKKGTPVTVEFSFKNPGMVPIIINDVKSVCGCTVPNFPKEPILSGKSGKITVTYDAKNTGHFTKTITVQSNSTEGSTKLIIKGEVK